MKVTPLVLLGASALVIAGCSTNSSPAITDAAADNAINGEDNPLVQQAVAEYRDYVAAQAKLTAATTTELTNAVRANQLQAAKGAYAPSREGWERIEPIAGLIEEIDGVVDSRVEGFAGPDDPEFTGWHRIEHIVFSENKTKPAHEFADELDADLQILTEQIGDVEVTGVDVAVGGAELIEEVSLGKITGEEDRYSKTDLWDFNANVEGAQKVVELLTPALAEAAPELLTGIESAFADLNASLAPLRTSDGWVNYCLEDDEYPAPQYCPEVTVSSEQVEQMKAQLATLSEQMSQIAGALGLG